MVERERKLRIIWFGKLVKVVTSVNSSFNLRSHYYIYMHAPRMFCSFELQYGGQKKKENESDQV